MWIQVLQASFQVTIQDTHTSTYQSLFLGPAFIIYFTTTDMIQLDCT